MKSIEEYSSIKEMERDFNIWFGVWLTGWDIEKGWVERDSSINAFTDDIIEIMLSITDWQFEEQDLKTMNKWNLVYWYCIRLLYLYNDTDEYFCYINNVFELLDSIRPYTP